MSLKRLSARVPSQTRLFPSPAVPLTATRAFSLCLTRLLTSCPLRRTLSLSRALTRIRTRRSTDIPPTQSRLPRLHSRLLPTRSSESCAISAYTPVRSTQAPPSITLLRTTGKEWVVSCRCTQTTGRTLKPFTPAILPLL